MKKYLIFTLTLLACVSLSYAQDEDTGSSSGDDSGEMGAKAGDFTGAIMFGRGHYLNLEGAPSAPGNNNNWTVVGNAPYANTVESNYNDVANVIGGEARYFITDVIAVKLTGGAVLRNAPALQNQQWFYVNNSGDLIQGNDPGTPTETWVPNYGSIQADNSVMSNFSVGGEYHFPSPRFNRLKPYLGAAFTYAYSRSSVYDPSVYYYNTVEASSATGSGAIYYPGSGLYSGSTGGSAGGIEIPDGSLVYDVGIRSAVVQGIGGHAVAGIDIYLVPGVYVGIETKPVSYNYNWNEKSPGPGLPTLQAKTDTWAFFAQTFFKIGFIVGKL